jgi:hypothetical protein
MSVNTSEPAFGLSGMDGVLGVCIRAPSGVFSHLVENHVVSLNFRDGQIGHDGHNMRLLSFLAVLFGHLLAQHTTKGAIQTAFSR